MATQAEPSTEAGLQLYETMRHWYDCPQSGKCGCGDNDELKAQIIKAENQAIVRAFEDLAHRFETHKGEYAQIDHIIASIKKGARRMRELGMA
jgi:hypothetical protein